MNCLGITSWEAKGEGGGGLKPGCKLSLNYDRLRGSVKPIT